MVFRRSNLKKLERASDKKVDTYRDLSASFAFNR